MDSTTTWFTHGRVTARRVVVMNMTSNFMTLTDQTAITKLGPMCVIRATIAARIQRLHHRQRAALLASRSESNSSDKSIEKHVYSTMILTKDVINRIDDSILQEVVIGVRLSLHTEYFVLVLDEATSKTSESLYQQNDSMIPLSAFETCPQIHMASMHESLLFAVKPNLSNDSIEDDDSLTTKMASLKISSNKEQDKNHIWTWVPKNLFKGCHIVNLTDALELARPTASPMIESRLFSNVKDYLDSIFEITDRKAMKLMHVTPNKKAIFRMESRIDLRTTFRSILNMYCIQHDIHLQIVDVLHESGLFLARDHAEASGKTLSEDGYHSPLAIRKRRFLNRVMNQILPYLIPDTDDFKGDYFVKNPKAIILLTNLPDDDNNQHLYDKETFNAVVGSLCDMLNESIAMYTKAILEEQKDSTFNPDDIPTVCLIVEWMVARSVKRDSTSRFTYTEGEPNEMGDGNKDGNDSDEDKNSNGNGEANNGNGLASALVGDDSTKHGAYGALQRHGFMTIPCIIRTNDRQQTTHGITATSTQLDDMIKHLILVDRMRDVLLDGTGIQLVSVSDRQAVDNELNDIVTGLVTRGTFSGKKILMAFRRTIATFINTKVSKRSNVSMELGALAKLIRECGMTITHITNEQMDVARYSSGDEWNNVPVVDASILARLRAATRNEQVSIRDAAIRDEQHLLDVIWGDSLIGMHDTKRNVLWSILTAGRQQLGVAAATGILLHGPSGAGKTLMLRRLAALCGRGRLAIAMNDDDEDNDDNENNDGARRLVALSVVEMNSTLVFSPYVGETERRIRGVFATARSRTPCLVLIDDAEVLAPPRDSRGDDTTGVDARVVATLLNELDGVAGGVGRGVCVVAASRNINTVDAAVLRAGRLGRHVAVTGVPTPTQLRELVKDVVLCNNAVDRQDMVDRHEMEDSMDGVVEMTCVDLPTNATFGTVLGASRRAVHV